LAAGAASAADPLAEARRLYNAGQYAEAIQMAREATAVQATADAARVILARAQLERFRQSADAADLAAAKEALTQADPRTLNYRDQIEWLVGQGEALYLDDRYGAASELFETVLDRSAALGQASHDRVLDWWATSLDRSAQPLDPDDRLPIYDRVIRRMR